MKKTNVLFIVPPVVPFEEIKSNKSISHLITNVSIPLGILSIAAYTGKHADVNFTIIDFNVEIVKKIDKLKPVDWDRFLIDILAGVNKYQHPDIVGISAIFNSNAGYLHPISDIAKRLWPDAIIVAGGGLPTNMYSYVFKMASAINAVVIGEGEKPFLGLVKANDKMHYLANAKGWMTRQNERDGFPPTSDFIEDLDEIPFLRYDLIEFDQYQRLSPYHGKRESNNICAGIMTSRGCPYFCSFCSSHTVHGRRFRYYSSERVLKDILKLKEIYGVNILLFQDDNFIVNKKRAMKILKSLASKDMTIEFPNGLSIMHLKEDVIDALKEAGLKIATLAVESGCERVLNEIIKKPYSKLSTVRNTVGLLREKDIYIRAFFIIGFPGESKEEIFESVNFMKDIGFNWVALFIATPIAGSEIYELCKKNNLLISDKLENFHYGKCNILLNHSTPEEIEKLRYLINLEVNFVENYDLKNGYYDIALIGFNDVINRVPNHAFAYYFASKCYHNLSDSKKEEDYLMKYYEILDNNSEWFEYAKLFNIQ